MITFFFFFTIQYELIDLNTTILVVHTILVYAHNTESVLRYSNNNNKSNDNNNMYLYNTTHTTCSSIDFTVKSKRPT